jgi:hypothetical protein
MVTVEGSDGKITQYRAQYVVAADGGKTAGPKIGVKMEGPTGLVDFVSTHFKADLSKYWDGKLSRAACICITDYCTKTGLLYATSLILKVGA